MTGPAPLGTVSAALDAAGIPFMVTGSVAASYYGAGRATMDVDLVIDPNAAQLRSLVASLAPDVFYVSLDAALEALRDRSLFNLIEFGSGWKVDCIVRKSRPFSEGEFSRRVPAIVMGVAVAVATVEDVILSKLEWAKLGGSARQLDDVRALLTVHEGRLDRAYLDRWVTALALAVEWKAVQS